MRELSVRTVPVANVCPMAVTVRQRGGVRVTSFTRLRRGRRRKKDEREGKVKKKMTRDEKEKKKRKSKEKDDQSGKEKSDWND